MCHDVVRSVGTARTILIHGKILIQNLWRSGSEWDEAVKDPEYHLWKERIKMIECIALVRIPRCYFELATRATYADLQLHIFVDASESAFACVVYFRTTGENGIPQCSLGTSQTVVRSKTGTPGMRIGNPFDEIRAREPIARSK